MGEKPSGARVGEIIGGRVGLLVDTDILIDVARGDISATSSLQEFGRHYMISISSVTEMELIVGCRNKNELRDLYKFLELFDVVSLTRQISDKAVSLLLEYRLSYGLLIPDALIAATALTQDLAFVTKNQRDYRFISGLNLLAYP